MPPYLNHLERDSRQLGVEFQVLIQGVDRVASHPRRAPLLPNLIIVPAKLKIYYKCANEITVATCNKTVRIKVNLSSDCSFQDQSQKENTNLKHFFLGEHTPRPPTPVKVSTAHPI